METKKFPFIVQKKMQSMSDMNKIAFIKEYNRKNKSVIVGYLLWLIGWQYAYIGKWGTQLLFWCTLGGFFIWWWLDIFRIPQIVKQKNDDISMDILTSMSVIFKDLSTESPA